MPLPIVREQRAALARSGCALNTARATLRLASAHCCHAGLLDAPPGSFMVRRRCAPLPIVCERRAALARSC